MQNHIDTISQSPLFQGFNVAEVESLLKNLNARVKTHPKGALVLSQGQTLSELLLLVRGCLELSHLDAWGNLSIVGQVCQGDIFGEAYAVSAGVKLMNDVVALEPCTVLSLNMQALMQSLAKPLHAKMAQHLFALLGNKNRHLVGKLSVLSKRSLRQKVLAYLSQESQKQGKATVRLPFNRSQMADFLAVDRSALSLELSKMQREGIITFRKNVFTLHVAQEGDF